MDDNAADTRWMDAREVGAQPGLTFDIELEINEGETLREIIAKAATALRTAALQLEAGKFDDGHHLVKTPTGEEIGSVYVDYHGTM